MRYKDVRKALMKNTDLGTVKMSKKYTINAHIETEMKIDFINV